MKSETGKNLLNRYKNFFSNEKISQKDKDAVYKNFLETYKSWEKEKIMRNEFLGIVRELLEREMTEIKEKETKKSEIDKNYLSYQSEILEFLKSEEFENNIKNYKIWRMKEEITKFAIKLLANKKIEIKREFSEDERDEKYSVYRTQMIDLLKSEEFQKDIKNTKY